LLSHLDALSIRRRNFIRIYYWVKGIAQPVATYAVVGLNQDAEQTGAEHLQLKLEIDRMSGDEREAAADALRRALGLLEKGGQGRH